MALIIAGRPRSGTTILQTLCDKHPDIALTNEFGNFLYLDQQYLDHAWNIFDRCQRVKGKWTFEIDSFGSKKPLAVVNLLFAAQYLWHLRKNYRKTVTVEAIEATYKLMYPNAKVIGDKLPHYLLSMRKLASQENLKRLVIYRDCRDVTSSFLKQARTNWKEAPWIHKLDTAEKIATSWVRDIDIMESLSERLMIVQYEKLMHQPEQELARISDWLGVDPAGFQKELLSTESIGKHKKGLTPDELETVMQVAGPTMERLGYL
ncbi:MAG: hypothetical protein DHS20C20_07700 [Ardenticatenaceae bacterium]|nr:MAG: hypothetical protein DHS20C20_07700 [Ardenticatenaceae bacterium]